MHKRKTFHEDNKFHGDSSGVIFCSSMGGRCPWWRILDFSWYMVASGPQRPRLANQEANGFRSFIFPYMLHFIYLMIYIYIFVIKNEHRVFSYKGATWDPDGHMVLIAFSKSSTLGSVHFASKPPSLGMQALFSSSNI